MNPSERANEEWSAERREAARGLLEALDVDPDLLDRAPTEILRFIDEQLVEVDTTDSVREQLFQLMSDVMSLVAEAIKVLHGARWQTSPGAPMAERHVLAGGALNRPMHIGSIALEVFQARNPSAVAIMNSAELEAGLRQTINDRLLPASPYFQQDPALPDLTTLQGARLRDLVRDAFRTAGRPATVFAAEATADGGHQMRLKELVPQLLADERGEAVWPEIVTRHVTTLIRSWDLRADGLSASEFRTQLYLRLVPFDPTQPNAYRYARVVAPGVAELLALDLLDSVKLLQDADLEGLGAPTELREQALANLKALPVEEHEVVRRGDRGSFDLVSGESFFTASRVLALPELLQQLGRTEPGEYGALVAFPHRHQLAVHVISGPEVIPSCNTMLAFAATTAQQAQGRISPHVYWWHNGTLTQLSQQAGDRLQISVGPEFQQVLEAVTRAERA